MREIKEIQKMVRARLGKERYEHTLGVMYTAAALAMRYGADMQDALLAGVLHDCAKCIPDERKQRLCEKYKIELSETERINPGLLHAKLGAYLAQTKYDVADVDVLNAIRSHTTGRPGMSLLEKIVYVADYIEPGRNHAPDLTYIRTLAFQNIDEAMYFILDATLSYLAGKENAVDPMTEATWSYYKELLGK